MAIGMYVVAAWIANAGLCLIGEILWRINKRKKYALIDTIGGYLFFLTVCVSLLWLYSNYGGTGANTFIDQPEY